MWFFKKSYFCRKRIYYQSKRKRFDIVIYDKTSKPYILIECKAFTVDITQEVFDQIGVYNLVIQAPFLLATNGILSYCFCQNHHSGKFTFLSSLPEL
ncbi:MAG: type I restriction enzyme HsdR N-terminal domain-containing protein [Saprospiraceae bacterium]|nr:type I restriction enzyme HsdR N-terminal domain-containing protein [Saprospiraceae bacterium]